MNKYILVFSLILGITVKSQVGINTNNPQQILHVDGKNSATTANPNSGAPSALQQTDDVVMTKEGYIGVGTSVPTRRVEITSSTAGAIKIVDGTQGAEKVLMSDANGVGTWRMLGNLKDLVRGTFFRTSTGGEISTTSDDSGIKYKYLNGSITLSKGKWVVNAGSTFKTNIANGQILWLHMYLSSSTSNSAISQTGFNHLGPAGALTSYAGQLHGFKDINPGGADNDNFVMGSSVIEVLVDQITLYLMVENLPTTVNGTNTGRKFFTTSGYWENYFYAIPLN